MTDTRPPDGHILVEGKPMGYWLPDEVSAEDIGVRNLQDESKECK